MNLERIKRKYRRVSIRNKILILLLLVVLASNLTNGMIVKSSINSHVEQRITEDNMRRCEQIAENLHAITLQIAENSIDVYLDIESQISMDEQLLQTRDLFSMKMSEYYEILTKPIRSFRYVHSFFVVTPGESYIQMRSNSRASLRRDVYSHVSSAVNPSKIISWTGMISADTFFRSPGNTKLISLILPIHRNNSTVAFLVVNLDADQFAEYLMNAQSEERLILEVSPGEYLTGRSSEEVLEDTELYSLLQDESRPKVVNLERSYLFTVPITGNNWKLSMLYGKEGMEESILKSVMRVFIQIAIIAVAMMILSSYLVFEVTHPIQKLTEEIEQSETSGELRNISFMPRTSDELGTLISTYNKLIDRTKETMTALEEKQEEARLAYLQALQMQINPHFLYNSLGNLRYLVEMQDPRATEMTVALGDYYKLAIIGSDDETTIASELQQAESYLKVMKFRYGSKFDYIVEPQEALGSNKIVKISIQPLVENAIYHGLKMKRGKGILRIRTFQEGNHAIVEVYDDGVGFTPEELSRIQARLLSKEKIVNSEHVGILNVNQRLKIHYGEQAGVEIESTRDVCTIARIVLPLEKLMREEPGDV